jgi:uncharacterized protein (TIGR00251 family)
MKIHLKVHAGSSQEKIIDLGNGMFEVWITEKAVEGKANEYLIKFLRKHFGKEVSLVSGFNSKRKIVEVGD